VGRAWPQAALVLGMVWGLASADYCWYANAGCIAAIDTASKLFGAEDKPKAGSRGKGRAPCMPDLVPVTLDQQQCHNTMIKRTACD
jgi:hypothetical protein